MDERQLVVFWKHYTMARDALKKGTWETKRYNVVQNESRFPFGVSFEQASQSILKEFGTRSATTPLEGGGHQFAEVIGYTVARQFTKEEIQSEKFEEGKLL